MAMTQYRDAAERARAEGKQPPAAPRPPRDRNNPQRPMGLYNGMIAPLIPYAIRGATWYQGESNAGQAWQYRTLFPAMIRNWREDWGQGDFPFLFVQLAPFMAKVSEPGESSWAELREAQLYTTRALPNTGMAVITDVGEENDIHPRKKEPVGARLALAARALAYGEKLPYRGPEFAGLKVEGNQAVLRFRNADGGLVARDGSLTGFAVAGEDRKWHNATAEIQGDRIVVRSPAVSRPAAVRYGWANFPLGNLWNGAGLPASPFRTDDWPVTTQPKTAATARN
jgi:sialate O-acetylesterase